MKNKITTEEESCIVRQAIQCSSRKRLKVVYDLISEGVGQQSGMSDDVPGNIKFYEILQLLNSLTSEFRSEVGSKYAEHLGSMNIKGFEDYKKPKLPPGDAPPELPPNVVLTAEQQRKQLEDLKIDDDDYASSEEEEESEVVHIDGPDISNERSQLYERIIRIVDFCYHHRRKLIKFSSETNLRLRESDIDKDENIQDKLRIAIIMKQLYKNIRICFEHDRIRDMNYLNIIPNPYVQHQGMKGLKNWMFRQYRTEMNCQYYFMYMSVRQVAQNADFTEERDVKEEYFKIQRHFSNTFARLYGRFRNIFSYLISWKNAPHPFALSTYPVHHRTTNAHKIHTFMWPDRIMNTLEYGSEVDNRIRMLVDGDHFTAHSRRNFPDPAHDKVGLKYEIIDDTMDLYYWIKFRDFSLQFTIIDDDGVEQTVNFTKHAVLYQNTMISYSDELVDLNKKVLNRSGAVFSRQELIDIQHTTRDLNSEFHDKDMVEEYLDQNNRFDAIVAYLGYMTSQTRFCIKNIHKWTTEDIPDGYYDDIYAAYNGKKISHYQGKDNEKIFNVLTDDPYDHSSYLRDKDNDEITSIAPDQTTIYSQSVSDSIAKNRETLSEGSFVSFTDRTHFMTRHRKHWKDLTPGMAGDMIHMKLIPLKEDVPHIWFKTTQKYMKPKHSNKDVKKMKSFEGWFANIITIDIVHQHKSSLHWKVFPDWMILMFKTLAHIAFNSKKMELEKKLIYIPLDRIALSGFVSENIFIYYMKHYLNFAIVGNTEIEPKDTQDGERQDAFFINSQNKDFVLDYSAENLFHIHSTFVGTENQVAPVIGDLNIQDRRVRTTPYEIFLIRPAPTMQEVWKMFQFYIISKLFEDKNVSQNIPNLKTFLETDFQLKSSRITTTSNKEFAGYYPRDEVEKFAVIDPYVRNSEGEQEDDED